jgi:hypothetical protein
MAVSSVSLTDCKDEITWRWSADGQFTVASAYNCRFHGSMTFFPATKVWQARSQPKCKFFAWLVLHDRALTADNMQKKNWPCNPTCQLCFCQLETSTHLLTGCNFAEAFWNSIAPIYNLPSYAAISSTGGPVDWSCGSLPLEVRKLLDQG